MLNNLNWNLCWASFILDGGKSKEFVPPSNLDNAIFKTSKMKLIQWVIIISHLYGVNYSVLSNSFISWDLKSWMLRDSKYSWTWEAFRALIWFEISFHVPGQIHFHFNMFSEKHDALEKNFHKLLIHDRSSSFFEKFPNSKKIFAKNWILFREFILRKVSVTLSINYQ